MEPLVAPAAMLLSSIFCLLACGIGTAAEQPTEPAPPQWMEGDFRDPRQGFLYMRIEDGKDAPKFRRIDQSVLIICWAPTPDNKQFGVYQIGGLEGYHSQEHVTRFLSALYDLEPPRDMRGAPLNVVIAGNNWGAGNELFPMLKELSQKKSFCVFDAGGWGFTKALLIQEPPERLGLIRKAHQIALDAEKKAATPPSADSKAK